MGRGPKPAKGKAKPTVAGKSPTDEGAKVRDLEKRLAEALEQVQARDRELAGAREQLTAAHAQVSESYEQQKSTSEILRIISRSPTNLHPVLDAIATNAALVCDAYDAVVFLRAGDGLRYAAHHGPINITLQHASLSRGSVSEAAILDRQPVHVPDLLATEPPAFPLTAKAAREGGFRTVLSVPLLRENEAIGALAIRRREVQPFTDQQIELLKTFADQAVIAIENVRLFEELEVRNTQLTESLGQQTATGEILSVIARSPTDIQPVFDSVVESAARLCEATDVAIYRRDGDRLRFVAHHGSIPPPGPVGKYHRPLERGSVNGRSVLEGRILHIADLQAETAEFPTGSDLARRLGLRTMLSVPLMRGGAAIGTIMVRRTEARLFSERQVALLQTFADQAVIAIENVRLFTELQQRNEALTQAHAQVTETLEQQTATGEILRVIASSPTDVQPVFDAIASSAARLCRTYDVFIRRLDEDGLRLVAHHGPIAAALLVPVSPRLVSGRAVRERRTIHVVDVQAAADEFPEGARLGEEFGHRTNLSVPLLREGVPLGVIGMRRAERNPFTDQEIALLQTFADQAVIAIENVRLFTELQEKNEALTQAHAKVTEALDQQTATSEILSVISSSPTDVQPVFDIIAKRATALTNAVYSAVYLVENESIHLRAYYPEDIPNTRQFAAVFPMPITSETLIAGTLRTGTMAHIPDMEAVSVPEGGRLLARTLGVRSTLTVPMRRDGNPIGAIGVNRRQPGDFSPAEIALLQTFADQAVIAIENVRLFTELQEKNRALTVAHAQVTESLEQQTSTAEILRVISRSHVDVQPVFDTIVASAVRLCRAHIGVVYQFDGAMLHLVAHHDLTPEMLDALRSLYPRPPQRDTVSGRAILIRAVVQIEDALVDREFHRDLALATNWRSMVAVPMLREGEPIGAIVINRMEAGAFADNHLDLLRTFADQAVIAVENVRLFTELQTTNRELTTALDTQTATSDILRVISRSQTDVQPVFDAILSSAVRLLGADAGALTRIAGEQIELAALTSTDDAGDAATRAVFPQSHRSDGPHAEAMRDRAPINIADAQADPRVPEAERATARARGFRSWVVVPLLSHDEAVGTFGLTRREPGGFSDAEIALLQTFADQAVIAIENARLLSELQERNASLSEALDQQTATSEILRVISESPTDVQPVFEVIAAHACRLCDGVFANVIRFDGTLMHNMAENGFTAEAREFLRRAFPSPPSRSSMSGRAILAATVVYVEDVTHDMEPGVSRDMGGRTGHRAMVSVPMLHNGVPVGAITVARLAAGRFAERQVNLLKTFADQAVIAIENVRLFNETKEALERQTATAEILRVIASSPTELQPVLDAVAENASRLCEASDAAILLVEGSQLKAVAHFGRTFADAVDRPVSREGVAGRAVIDRETIHLHNVFEAHDFPMAQQLSLADGSRTVLATPLMREGAALGAILIRRNAVRPFSDRHIALLKTFADQAVIAIENVRLFKELEARNRDLTATGEILRVIAGSPTDIQPVFETIFGNATRLCDAQRAGLFLFDGETYRAVAFRGANPALIEHHTQGPIRPGPRTALGRIVRELRPVHIHDVTADAADGDPVRRAVIELEGMRTLLMVPLLREARLVGALSLYRREVRPFTDEQIALLQTFADQAVIAIENVRLFKELEARTQDLTRSVGELRALGEVGQTISSTLDLQTVLTTIVGRATHLAGMDAGVIYEYDEGREVFEPRATERLEEDIVRALVATPIRKGEGATGRLAEVREPIQVADVRDSAQPFQAREVLVRAGYRAALAVPLMREDRLLGGLTVFRRTPGEFAPEVVDLLRTFATQSALAIQNARLFREIEDKSRQLEVASQHKSEFLANMSHELRTPLNAIIGFSEVLSDRMFGELNEKQDEYLKDIYASGTHLLSLINDILDLSKIEAGRMELELTDFDLPTALDNALMLVRERAQRRSLTLEKDVDAGVGQIQGDERKIRQVVLNLLSNAIKFTPEGGRIELAAVPKDGLVEVSVSDTGVGIAPEDQEKVFEEFRQVGTADKKAEGTGLGLTLCRKFIELHAGKLWVKSQLGAGSTFTFTIPVRHAE